ncbi:MAG: 4-vinyl reductase, partial [Anaerolineales bacterium]
MAREDAVIVNALVRQALISVQEVMGENGLNTVLRTSGLERYIGNFPPNDLEPAIQTSDYARLNEAIEEFYGRGGRGMLRRVGKASFQYAVREQAAL